MKLKAALELAPQEYRDALADTIKNYGVENIPEFLATVYYESSYLTSLEENLNYSSDALLKNFSRKRISYEEAIRYGRGPGKPAFKEAIANCIYGGDFGRTQLGNFIEGDGWHYRGQGAIQLTGRANWERFAAHVCRQDIADNPQIALRDPIMVCDSAGWFWTYYKNINSCGSNMRTVTKKVTGAPDTGIKTRLKYRDRVLSFL